MLFRLKKAAGAITILTLSLKQNWNILHCGLNFLHRSKHLWIRLLLRIALALWCWVLNVEGELFQYHISNHCIGYRINRSLYSMNDVNCLFHITIENDRKNKISIIFAQKCSERKGLTKWSCLAGDRLHLISFSVMLVWCKTHSIRSLWFKLLITR